MRIKELVKKSGVPRTTIHFYLRHGLLPPPHKTGRTMAYYDDYHLHRLQTIEKLKKGSRMPIASGEVRSMPERALPRRRTAIAQALRPARRLAGRIRIGDPANEGRRRRSALFGVCGRDPLGVGRQSRARPAAERVGLEPGDVGRGLVVRRGRLAAERPRPVPTGLAHPAGFVDRAPARALGRGARTRGLYEPAELAHRRLGRSSGLRP